MQEVNVQVAVRVRPLLQKEKLAGETVCVRILPSDNQVVLGKDHHFTFDQVFSARSTQEEMYVKCIDPLVRSCLEGYNATVFAYGQTGSGKTYTIGGGSLISQAVEGLGMIPRAIQQIYSSIQHDANHEYTVKVSYFEIHKEELRDLMEFDSDKGLHIREDEKGNTMIIGAMEAECVSAEEVMQHLRRGSSMRHTGSTQMNEHSSRSHSIFTLIIAQTWTDDEPSSAGSLRRTRNNTYQEDTPDDAAEIVHYKCAKFHFVDLAGSERVHRTGNVGERFKESVHINSGLLALGNVISALGDPKRKIAHIPYRDSKVTRLLKDSLGGNAKTLMICCISPSSASMDESLNALKYANRARNIKNKPVVNRDPQLIRFEEMQGEIKALRDELHRQRTSLGTAVAPETRDDTDEHCRRLQLQLDRLLTECSHYRTILEEACRQLVDLRDRGALTQSQAVRLCDWMELMEEIRNSVPETLDRTAWDNQMIRNLENELRQCRSDLCSDDEIFAKKAQELSTAQERADDLRADNERLARRLSDAEHQCARIEGQLLAKQIELDRLSGRIEDIETARHSMEISLSGAPAAATMPGTRPRAVSVPSHLLDGRKAAKQTSDNADSLAVSVAARGSTRNIHTSPAAITVDRVLHSFRARSRLLLSQLEDADDVVVRSFSDEEEGQGGEDTGESGEGKGVTGGGGTDEEMDGGGQIERSAFSRSENSRGTYRVRKSQINRPQMSQNVFCSSGGGVGGEAGDMGGEEGGGGGLEEDRLFVLAGSGKGARSRGAQVLQLGGSRTTPVAEVQRGRTGVKQAEHDLRRSTLKLNDLKLNIKMKEQLIRDLVRQGQEVEQLNLGQVERIRALEAEKTAANQELFNLQKATQDLKQQERARNEQLQAEYRKKVDIASAKILQCRKEQREAAGKAAENSMPDKKVEDLLTEVELLRRQETDLSQQKACLEQELDREQERMRDMMQHTNQLTAKLEKMTAEQKQQVASSRGRMSAEQTRIEEQARWLDREMEALVEQRKAAEKLEKELENRAAMIAKKEAMLAEKSELQMKKLRSSQVVGKDMLRLSSRLDTVDEQIEKKSHELAVTPREGQGRLQEEMDKLRQGRQRISSEYAVLSAKMSDGELLSTFEERGLIEMEEAIEAIDAAIVFKSESIARHEAQLRQSRAALLSPGALAGSAGGPGGEGAVGRVQLMGRLQGLSAGDARVLLQRYFEKAVNLRNEQRRMERACAEVQVRADEQAAVIHELESSLQLATADMERRLTNQKLNYERQIQLLLKQITETELGARPSANVSALKENEAKIAELEKELYYYKKTSRDLRRKLKDASLGVMGAANNDSKDVSENGFDEYVPTPRPGPDGITDSRSRPNSAKPVEAIRVQALHSTTSGKPEPERRPVPREINPSANPLQPQRQVPQPRDLTQNVDSTGQSDVAPVPAARSQPPRSQTNAGAQLPPPREAQKSSAVSDSRVSHHPTADLVADRLSAKFDNLTSARTSREVAEPTPPSSRPDRLSRREPRCRSSVDAPVRSGQGGGAELTEGGGRNKGTSELSLVDSLDVG